MSWAAVRAAIAEYRAITDTTKVDQVVELIFFLAASAILAVSTAAVLIMGGQ